MVSRKMGSLGVEKEHGKVGSQEAMGVIDRTDNDLMAVAVPLLVSQGVSVGTYVC